jgi:hypothetical protein
MNTQILAHQVMNDLRDLLHMKQDMIDNSEQIVITVTVGQPVRIEYKTIARRDEAKQ